MEPVATREAFEEDAELPITELDDGSAIVEIPEETASESDFYSNLAEELDFFTLNSIATDYLELIEKDKEARKKRDEQYAEGIRRTGLGDDAPGGAQFDGASRVVHPVLAEGCVDFAARAIKELFPANGPVRTKIIGESNSKKLDKAKKKRDFLNHILINRVQEYRAEKEILLTQLPLGGSQYEKYYRDPSKKRICMEFVPVDKVLLPYSAASFYTSPRVTHVQDDITEALFERRVKAGFYVDIDNIITSESPDGTSSERATDKIEGKSENEYNEDGLRTIYEISCEMDLEDDGNVAPYILHIDEPTSKVLAIYRNWEENDETQQRQEFWVEDKFLPWRGAYGIGLPHLIGGLAAALTGALRALLDSAHINNSPGAVKLKGGRTSGQNLSIPQTGVEEIEAPAGVDDIRKMIMPLPFNPPSAVLFQLLDWITAQAKGVVATAEERIADAGNQMPVGTTLALIEQGSQVFSSIHSRLHDSQRRALAIICRLISQYPEDYTEEFEKFELTAEDFAENDDIEPVSDPNIFSEAQRYAQLQETLKVVQLFPQLDWKIKEVARRALELLRIDGVDSILPKDPETVTSDPVTENVAAANGAPLKAVALQDHLAHAMTHVGYVMNPIHQLNPSPQPYLMAILGHVAEHLNLYYQVAAQAQAAAVYQEDPELSADQIAMRAARAAQQQNIETIGQLAPMIQQATKFAQSKAPQPQLPPEVQTTKDLGMAQIASNEKVAQGKLQADMQKFQAEQQASQAAEQLRMQIAQMQESNKSAIAQMAAQSEAQLAMQHEQNATALERMRQQVEIMKNDRDNEQRQMTDLLKNRDDNQTNILIERMKQELAPALTPQVDTGGNDEMLKQMQEMLNAIEKAKTGDALTAAVDGLRQMMAGQREHQTNMLGMAQQLLSSEV